MSHIYNGISHEYQLKSILELSNCHKDPIGKHWTVTSRSFAWNLLEFSFYIWLSIPFFITMKKDCVILVCKLYFKNDSNLISSFETINEIINQNKNYDFDSTLWGKCCHFFIYPFFPVIFFEMILIYHTFVRILIQILS